MAKFIFSLQSLLNMKMQTEQQIKMEYRKVQDILMQEEEKLTGLREQKKHYENKLRNSIQQNLVIIEIRKLEQAVEVTKENIEKQKKEVEKAQKNVDIVSERLKQIMSERKTYEKLREKELEAFLKELDEKEKKEIDELISYKYSIQSDREDEE